VEVQSDAYRNYYYYCSEKSDNRQFYIPCTTALNIMEVNSVSSVLYDKEY